MTHVSRRIKVLPGERSYRVRLHQDATLSWVLDFERWLDQSETLSSKTTDATNVTVSSSSLSGQTMLLTLAGGDQDGYVDITVTTSASNVIALRLHVDADQPAESIWR